MTDETAISGYLLDLGRLISERALVAKRDKETARDGASRAYATGRLMGLHEVISLMQQQAIAFGLPAEVVGLDAIDPERDLV